MLTASGAALWPRLHKGESCSYRVERIGAREARRYIHTHHYSHGSHRSPSPCYGLYDGDALVGAIMFATPVGETVRESVFGPERRKAVIELHRLHVLDGTPQNTESYFVSRALKLLRADRPDIKAVISFADPTVGHRGTVYRACNALYVGRAKARPIYMDQSGRLRHHRQNGRNINQQDALSRGWTILRQQRKYRYLWLIGSPLERRALRAALLLTPEPYPA